MPLTERWLFEPDAKPGPCCTNLPSACSRTPANLPRVRQTTARFPAMRPYSFSPAADTCPTVLLRKTRNGEEGNPGKDWRGEARPDGMHLRFGRTGTVGQYRHIPADACCRKDPVLELRQRAARKLREGYVLVREENIR